MVERIRICFISFQFWPDIGGSQVRTEKQAHQLQALGHAVTVVTLRLDRRWKPAELLDGLQVVRVGGIYKSGSRLHIGKFGQLPIEIGMFVTLWRLRRSYDVIHVAQVSPLAVVAALIGKMTGKPVVVSVQSAGPDEAQRARLEHGASLMADGLAETAFFKVDPSKKWLVVGDDISYLSLVSLGGRAMVDFLRRSNVIYQVLSTRSHSCLPSRGFRAEQLVYIPGSVDTEKFRPDPAKRPDPARPERDIICVARLAFQKGVDVLLHAWWQMMHAPAQWHTHLRPRLRIVGDGEFRPQMERIVAELAIGESVEFLGWRTDITDLLQRSWGFVLPSRWEGMPNALLEAMACGLPCLATRVSGSEDIICDGANGLLVEPEQPAEMAQALCRIVEDTELAQQLGQQGRATVVRDYQLSNVVEQCLELYRRLLKNQEQR